MRTLKKASRVFNAIDHFFERAVAGALADAIDGALDLARTGHDGGQAVGHRHAQIIMTVDRKADLVDAAHVLAQVAEQLREFIRDGVADRVRNVDRARTGLDGRFHDLGQELQLGAGSILGRELHVLAQFARQLHALDGRAQDFFLRHVELVLAMNGARGQEHMNAVLRGAACRAFAASSMSSRLQRARPQMIGPLYLARYRIDRFPIPPRGGGETRLDDIDTELGKRACDPQLFRLGHAAAGRLLAVAQRGVENQDSVWIGSHGLLLYKRTFRVLINAPCYARRSFSQGIRARSSAPTFSIWRSVSCFSSLS